MTWTEEELREMAEADAEIEADHSCDLEFSKQLDQYAKEHDPSVDPKTRRKRQWNRAYYKLHKDAILASNKLYRDAHKDEINERRRTDSLYKAREKIRKQDYYYRNAVELRRKDRERNAAKRALNPPKERPKLSEEERRKRQREARARYRAAHREEIRQRERERYANDPECRERHKARSRKHYWKKKKEGDANVISE